MDGPIEHASPKTPSDGIHARRRDELTVHRDKKISRGKAEFSPSALPSDHQSSDAVGASQALSSPLDISLQKGLPNSGGRDGRLAGPDGRDHVHRAVDRFQDPSGGFILGPTNAVTAEVPYENLVALYETLLEYR